MAVCKLCGLLATLNAPRGLSACSACKQRECVELVRIPHPMKALIQELYATGIALRPYFEISGEVFSAFPAFSPGSAS